MSLPDPFFVLATQNPIEQEGTYPLPEAQLDRFLFKIFITYPTPDEERRIYRLTTAADLPGDHAAASPASGSRPCSGWSGACRSRTSASTTRWTWSGRRAGPSTAARSTSATGSPGVRGRVPGRR